MCQINELYGRSACIPKSVYSMSSIYLVVTAAPALNLKLAFFPPLQDHASEARAGEIKRARAGNRCSLGAFLDFTSAAPRLCCEIAWQEMQGGVPR